MCGPSQPKLSNRTFVRGWYLQLGSSFFCHLQRDKMQPRNVLRDDSLGCFASTSGLESVYVRCAWFQKRFTVKLGTRRHTSVRKDECRRSTAHEDNLNDARNNHEGKALEDAFRVALVYKTTY